MDDSRAFPLCLFLEFEAYEDIYVVVALAHRSLIKLKNMETDATAQDEYFRYFREQNMLSFLTSSCLYTTDKTALKLARELPNMQAVGGHV